MGTSRAGWRRQNPPATAVEYRTARRIAREVAREFARRGAIAVVFAGSWVRGDAHRHSDIDLWVFGRRREAEVLWRAPFMVCVYHTTAIEERRKMRSPPRVGGVVPAWRHARVLYDPRGTAAALKRTARAVRWRPLDRVCDRWVARSVVGWGEEATKLVRALGRGSLATAAVQRNLLADGLATVLAVRRRAFWDSENEFWERVGRSARGRWARAHRQALGLGRTSFAQSCRAALELYAETARITRSTFAPAQRAVVVSVLETIGAPLGQVKYSDR